LGVALDEKGETNEAIDQYQEALRLEPDFSAAQNNLAKAQAVAAQGARSK
jgi:Flp pilus assembly protein TadD